MQAGSNVSQLEESGWDLWGKEGQEGGEAEVMGRNGARPGLGDRAGLWDRAGVSSCVLSVSLPQQMLVPFVTTSF